MMGSSKHQEPSSFENKVQAPTTNLQRSSKLQESTCPAYQRSSCQTKHEVHGYFREASSTKIQKRRQRCAQFGVWCLMFLWSLDVDAWSLSSRFLLELISATSYCRLMKRISFLLMTLSLCASPAARSQDAATE